MRRGTVLPPLVKTAALAVGLMVVLSAASTPANAYFDEWCSESFPFGCSFLFSFCTPHSVPPGFKCECEPIEGGHECRTFYVPPPNQ